MRVYADESGTHDSEWFVIGMLFVPDHGTLHPKLLRDKDALGYLNLDQRRKAKYKETHFAAFRSKRDMAIGRAWIDRFLASASVFRSVVVEWSQFQGKYFGGPFDSDALKKRRAYKKWAEMLLQPELGKIYNARFILDHLRALYDYDVVDHLQERFCLDDRGEPYRRPRIQSFQTARSWKDANQCLQLCDLLVGCVYQSLCPSQNQTKLAVTDYLYERLQDHGVGNGKASGYWRQYGDAVRKHHPKFSEWFWRPSQSKKNP